MSPGSPQTRPELSLDARKQLALVACTLDRIALLARLRERAERPHGLAALRGGAWVGPAIAIATRLLPPKLRLASTLLHLWRRR